MYLIVRSTRFKGCHTKRGGSLVKENMLVLGRQVVRLCRCWTQGTIKDLKSLIAGRDHGIPRRTGHLGSRRN